MYFYCDCSLQRLKRSHSGNQATLSATRGFQPVLPSSRLSASVAQLRAFTQCSARLPARAEPWRRSQSVPGAFYQCTEDAGVFNEYVKHGVMAE